MSGAQGEPATALSFFDPERGVHATIRSGLTLLFDGRNAEARKAAAEIQPEADGWRAKVGDDIDVRFEPVTEPVDLAGIETSVCRVQGTLSGRKLDALGTASQTHHAPRWEELDGVRAVSAVFSADLAAIAIGRRPRDAAGHGDELVNGCLIETGELRSPEDARISTVYDGGGRQHSAGLELWFPGEDYPRRLFGMVQAGTSLELDGLTVHAAVFSWRMEGHTGAGLYELTLRGGEDQPAAA